MAAILPGLGPHGALPLNAGLKPFFHNCGAFVLLALLLLSPSVAAQEHAAPPAQAPPAADHAPGGSQDSHAPAGEVHEESIWPQVGKIVNFAILVGTVVYFGRKPISSYFASRRAQVRSDLVAAEEMKKSAAAQIAEMDAKLKALPAELDALKARGQQEIAAEEQRIRELAETERARLLEQASREIAQRTRLARRELVEHAASLAVDVAQTKIKAQITDTDQARLVDRYLTEVKSHE
jgi:F-type H+-transporting ATPase subunit b